MFASETGLLGIFAASIETDYDIKLMPTGFIEPTLNAYVAPVVSPVAMKLLEATFDARVIQVLVA